MGKQIADYAIVGDGQTAALIARDGSVDFLCWPRFDSDSPFNAILGDDSHGHWRIAPAAASGAEPGPEPGVERRYAGDTLILESLWSLPGGQVRVTDFMPPRPNDSDAPSTLIRIVEGVEGSVAMHMSLCLRFDYGSMSPWARPHDNGVLCEIGPNQVVLYSPLPITLENAASLLDFTIAAGERQVFVLGYTAAHCPPAPMPDAAAALRDADRYWRDWMARYDKHTPWDMAVKRSLLTLKALIHAPSGGLLAAATTSLPEKPGGSMNWDYRYSWLRDATFTLTALLNAGYQEEARSWSDWIKRAIGGDPDKIQIMYRLDGRRHLDEWEVDWLPGFEGAGPVRIGNQAAGQKQLDVLGELVDAMHFSRRAGLDTQERALEVETVLIRHIEQVWDRPGSDIWESRSEPQRYTLSMAMAWVAIDRHLNGHDSADRLDDDRLDTLGRLARTIHDMVYEKGFDPKRQSFVQAFGSDTLDASLLLLPLVGFLPVSDPRMAGTIAAIEAELMEDGFVRRKKAPDTGAHEGSFLACSCWLAQCMVLQGRRDEARAMIDRIVGVSNDVGLLAEEYHVGERRLLGNIPQALSHLGLINAVMDYCGEGISRIR